MKFAFTCQIYVQNTNIYNEMYDIIKIYVPTRNEMEEFGLNEKMKKNLRLITKKDLNCLIKCFRSFWHSREDDCLNLCWNNCNDSETVWTFLIEIHQIEQTFLTLWAKTDLKGSGICTILNHNQSLITDLESVFSNVSNPWHKIDPNKERTRLQLKL